MRHTLETVYPWCLDWEEELGGLCRAYVEVKLEQRLLDYDDLLLYWHLMMREPALAAQVGARFDHVLVDEYQDTNVLQAGILLALRPDGRGVTVVGDDAQSIYSFRAATVDNILEFPARFTPPARVVTLEQNYRSTQAVLDSANALLRQAERQHPKRLESSRGRGVRPQYVTVLDDQAQADYVVGRVLAARERGLALRKQAVLFRAADHSDLLELELMRRNVPFVKYGGLKFLEAAHVKDLLAVLRFADNPRNRLAGFRVLQLLPGMGPANAEKASDALAAAGYRWSALAEWSAPAAAREHWGRLVELLAAIGGESAPWAGQVERVRRWLQPQLERLYDNPVPRLGDLEMLGRLAAQYESRASFVTELTLDPPQATGDLAGPPLLDEDYLVLSTVHSAKGQEWDAVYLLNLTDGSFPSEFATGRPESIEEERRLLYVAMTRARDELHLLAPVRFYVTQQSPQGDRYVHGARSRFITAEVLATLEQGSWPADPAGGPATGRPGGRRAVHRPGRAIARALVGRPVPGIEKARHQGRASVVQPCDRHGRRLPIVSFRLPAAGAAAARTAAVAAAATRTAATAAAVAATATRAATAAAAVAATATRAATATAISTTTAAAATRARALLRLVHAQRTTAEVVAVQGGHGALGIGLRHLHEAEATRPAGLAIGRQRDRVDGAVLREQVTDVGLGGREGKVAHVDLGHSNILKH